MFRSGGRAAPDGRRPFRSCGSSLLLGIISLRDCGIKHYRKAYRADAFILKIYVGLGVERLLKTAGADEA